MSVPLGRWLRAGTPLAQPYPCNCWGTCSPTWCACSGRTDVHNVPASCCSRNGNTPRRAAQANHLYASPGKSPCWCNGEVERHQDIAIQPVAGVLTDPDTEEDE